MTITAPLVCIVDDADDYRFLLETNFKQYLPNCLLHLFTDGEDFLAALPQLSQKPQLIILDQHMPGWSGHQTLIALKQQTIYRSIPVVMMSADATHSEIACFYQAGAAAFLRKSVEFNGLQENLLNAYQYASKLN